MTPRGRYLPEKTACRLTIGGIAPFNGREPRRGTGFAAAVGKTQARQTDGEAPVRTAKRLPLRTCTLLSDVHSPMSTRALDRRCRDR